MSRLPTISLSTALFTLAAASCTDGTDPSLAPPTEAERPEIGQTYDVATGQVTEDTEVSLAALRDPVEHAPLPGALGPKPGQAEESIIRADNGLLMVLPAGEQALLAVNMRQGAALGIVMIEARDAAAAIGRAL